MDTLYLQNKKAINEIKYFVMFFAIKRAARAGENHFGEFPTGQYCSCRKIRRFAALYLVVVVIAIPDGLW